MGCDIHAHAETKWEKRTWDQAFIRHSGGELDIVRNYPLFALLAGVRGWERPIVEQRGLPSRMSSGVSESYAYWGALAHSASWLTFREMKKMPGAYKKEPFYVYLKALAEKYGEDNVRMVFWFDN